MPIFGSNKGNIPGTLRRQVVYEHGEGSGLYTPVYTYALKAVSIDHQQTGLDLSELSREGWEVVSLYQYAYAGVLRAVCRRPLLDGGADGE